MKNLMILLLTVAMLSGLLTACDDEKGKGNSRGALRRAKVKHQTQEHHAIQTKTIFKIPALSMIPRQIQMMK
jgi:hypothetical protein